MSAVWMQNKMFLLGLEISRWIQDPHNNIFCRASQYYHRWFIIWAVYRNFWQEFQIKVKFIGFWWKQRGGGGHSVDVGGCCTLWLMCLEPVPGIAIYNIHFIKPGYEGVFVDIGLITLILEMREMDCNLKRNTRGFETIKSSLYPLKYSTNKIPAFNCNQMQLWWCPKVPLLVPLTC